MEPMPKPNMSSFLKKARYLLPFVKPLTLGIVDPEDETIKELGEAGLDLLGDEAKEKIKDYITKQPDEATGFIDEHLVRYTGAVLETLVKRYAKKEALEEHRADLLALAKRTPEAWSEFLKTNDLKMPALRKDAFHNRLAAALNPKSPSQALESEAFVEFFRWLAKQKALLGPLKPGLTPPLTRWITKHLDQNLFTELCNNTPKSKAAFKDTVLRFHASAHHKLNVALAVLDRQNASLSRIEAKQCDQATHKDVTSLKDSMELSAKELKQLRDQFEKTTPLHLYREGLKEEYHFIEVITLDTAEDPKVREAISENGIVLKEAYVEPPCSENYQHPEEFDAAVIKNKAQWEPFMARLSRHRRIVLLADPGMGKSTLIRSLLHSIASKKAPQEAGAELSCCVPFPLILRNLVPMLLERQPNSSKWRWADLIDVFLSWCPGNSTRPLLEPFTSSAAHRANLQQLLESPLAFFLIDGLDEVGSISLRRDMQRVLWEGFRISHAQARFLITSRVIGYDAASIHVEKVGSIATPARAHIQVERLKTGISGDLSLPDLTEEAGGTPLFEPRAQLLHLTPFTDRHQRQFAHYWFGKRFSRGGAEGTTERFIQAAHAHESVRLIGRNPYILLLLVFVYQDKHELPDGRTKIYDRVAELYLKVLDDKARLNNRLGPIARSSPNQKKRWLQLIAMQMQLQRTAISQTKHKRSKNDLRETHAATGIDIANWLGGHIDKNGYQDDQDAARAFVEYLGERTGLLVPRGPDHFEWHHNSFMEFFAALYIRDELSVVDQLRLYGLDPFSPRAALEDKGLPMESLPGPIPARYLELASWAGDERWREVIIFLLEYMAGPGKSLELTRHLQGIFPALHGSGKLDSKKNLPLLPISAVDLAVRIAQDRHLDLATATRKSWWNTLWSAYLDWPHAPWNDDQSKRWHIAPILLSGLNHRKEAIQSLVDICHSKANYRPLNFYQCTELTLADLTLITEQLPLLQGLDLDSCTGLDDLPDLNACKHLQQLDLRNCTGLKPKLAFHKFNNLKTLTSLSLSHWKELECLPDLSSLESLQLLYLMGCTGFKHTDSIKNLTKLMSLENLSLSACTGLKRLPDLGNLQNLTRFYLQSCTSLTGDDALDGIVNLKALQFLHLSGCTKLERLPNLIELNNLSFVDLSYCTNLKGLDSFNGLANVKSLRSLDLSGCTQLEPGLLEKLKEMVPQECKITITNQQDRQPAS